MAGSVVITRSTTPLDPHKKETSTLEVIRVAWVGDVADGTVPATAFAVRGELLRAVTNPGSPAPTTLYDITLTDEDGFDVLEGDGDDRSATVTEEIPIEMANGAPRVVAGDLTFALTGNAVLSAQGVFVLYLRQA